MEHVPPRGKVWFTSDWHLGHRRILDYCKRPFSTIEEHDAAIIQAVRDTVGEGDTLYVLGDVAMSSIRKYRAELAELPGVRYLVCGNHDPSWHGFKGPNQKSRDPKRYELAGFAEVNVGEPGKEWMLSYEALGWDGIAQVALSHFPKEAEATETEHVGSVKAGGAETSHAYRDRYAAYRPAYKGIPILCGHVHDSWQTKGLNINVGVDVWNYKPVGAEQLWELVRHMQVKHQWPNQRY